MGMQFSPMYQPVSTKTIKADGDLDVSPYDVVAYDGRFDTVEADEFVGGVGNFESIIVQNPLTLSYNGYVDITFSGDAYGSYSCTPFLISTQPVTGKVSCSYNGNDSYDVSTTLNVLSTNGLTRHTLSSTLQDFNVINAINIWFTTRLNPHYSTTTTLKVGIPVIS